MLAVSVSVIVLLYLGNPAPAAGAVWRHYGATGNGPLHEDDVEMVLGHGFNVGAKATSDRPGEKAVHNQVGVMKIITSHVVNLNAANVSGEGRISGGGNDVVTLLGNGTTEVHCDLNGGDVAVQGVDNVVEARFSSNFNTRGNSLTAPTDGTALGRSDKTVNLVITPPGANIRHGVSNKGDSALHKLDIYSQEDALQALFSGKVNAKPNNFETSFSGTTFGANIPNSMHSSSYGQEKAVRIPIGGNVKPKGTDVVATPGNEKTVKLVISGAGNTPKSTSRYTVGHTDGKRSGIQAPLGENAYVKNLAFPTSVSGGTSISNSASSKGDATLPYGQEKAVRILIGGNVSVKGNSAMPIDFADTRGAEKTVNLVISANVHKGVGGTKDPTFHYGQTNSLTTPLGTGPRDTEKVVNVVISSVPDNKRSQALDKATKSHSGYFHGDDQVTKVISQGENLNSATDNRDVTLRRTVGIFTSHGDVNSPLHTAAWHGHQNAIKTLLEGGANVNAKNKESETPLDIAAARDYAGIIKVLLSSGANPNEVNARGGTPLHVASWHGQINAINALLDAGSDITARNNHSQTPLDTATSRDHAKVVSLLLSRGANPNDRNDSGDTPLHAAAWYGQENAAKALIDGGADINAKNLQGKTALQVATARGNHNVGSLLFDRGQKDLASAIDVRSNMVRN
ncbi:hypothetical protein PPYR_13341 [Photinus pyralis]|uniref:Uncharacterized protein n=2 Tax=Photinus pyralis TaxID=7054 RepID=A0A5N4A8R6_PHOPY|nr:putative ankyrin repeat protein RF_0381 isoform X2 [Photinus pyralis]KAB0793721.1 hypothetical protein PPYR_13341 [Photinus pyralis]